MSRNGVVHRTWIPACAGMTGGSAMSRVSLVHRTWIPAFAGMTARASSCPAHADVGAVEGAFAVGERDAQAAVGGDAGGDAVVDVVAAGDADFVAGERVERRPARGEGG